MISYKGCDMIAMKREVAAKMAGFPWSECQVRKLTTSHCTETEDHEMVENNVCFRLTDGQPKARPQPKHACRP